MGERVKRCAQCGAEVRLAANVFTASCAFCDSPLVDAEANIEPADLVVPFHHVRIDTARGIR